MAGPASPRSCAWTCPGPRRQRPVPARRRPVLRGWPTTPAWARRSPPPASRPTFDHDVEGVFGGFNLRGNAGLQAVHASQHAEGWEYRGDDEIPDKSPFVRRTGAPANPHPPQPQPDGRLPQQLPRPPGLGQTMVRPNFVDMRAGTSTRACCLTCQPRMRANGPRPTAATPRSRSPGSLRAGTISLEKYAPASAAASRWPSSHKNLNSRLQPAHRHQQRRLPHHLGPGRRGARDIAPFIQPLNGTGGKVDGTELVFLCAGSRPAARRAQGLRRRGQRQQSCAATSGPGTPTRP